jgi:uncharacterized protein YecE (DUF72 family)
MNAPSDAPAVAANPDRSVWIGCSGYAYKHWRGPFYPPDLPTTRWLAHYIRFFPTVELNNTFYTLPGPRTFAAWRDNTPPGFIFAVKASRFLTHMKKLKEPQEPLARLFDRATLLAPKLGPILYQLPPRWHFDAERLAAFLAALPGGLQHAIEVRDPSWLNEQFFALLEQHRVAYCITSLPAYQTPVVATAPFVYFRFHGSGQMYYYDYRPDELRVWRDAILRFAEAGRTVYCYFDNDPEGWAVRNALELTRLVNAEAPIA